MQTAASLEKYVSTLKPLDLILVVGAGFFLWQSMKGWQQLQKAGDAVGSYLGETYVELTNPLVSPQIKIKPSYFDTMGILLPEAKRVISEGFPNLYRVAFMGNMLRPEYHYLLNGQHVTDKEFMQ